MLAGRGERGAQRGPRWDCGARLPPLHLQAMRCRHSGLRGAGGDRASRAGQESRAAAPGPAVLCLGRSCCGASGLDTQTSGWGRLPRGPASSPPHGTPSPQRPCPISGALPCFPGEPLSLCTLHHCWNTHVWGSPAPRTCSHGYHGMGNTLLEMVFANKAPQAGLWAAEFAEGGGLGKRAVCRCNSRLPPPKRSPVGGSPVSSTALWFG